MSVHSDAVSVIEETLAAIAADPVATLVGDALRAAWDGQGFDEALLRGTLVNLQRQEAAS
jgi:hypothetical protein